MKWNIPIGLPKLKLFRAQCKFRGCSRHICQTSLAWSGYFWKTGYLPSDKHWKSQESVIGATGVGIRLFSNFAALRHVSKNDSASAILQNTNLGTTSSQFSVATCSVVLICSSLSCVHNFCLVSSFSFQKWQTKPFSLCWFWPASPLWRSLPKIQKIRKVCIRTVLSRCLDAMRSYFSVCCEILPEIDGPVVGIDLGTTYSCVGIYKNGRVEIIPNDQVNSLLPCLISWTV
jgi:hypothetical protein